MRGKKLKADRSLRAKLRSRGRPPVLHRSERWPFWKAIAQGHSSEDAAGLAGVSPAVDNRWFGQCVDNSAAERALRGVALGRNNYLFMGSEDGGERCVAIQPDGKGQAQWAGSGLEGACLA